MLAVTGRPSLRIQLGETGRPASAVDQHLPYKLACRSVGWSSSISSDRRFLAPGNSSSSRGGPLGRGADLVALDLDVALASDQVEVQPLGQPPRAGDRVVEDEVVGAVRGSPDQKGHLAVPPESAFLLVEPLGEHRRRAHALGPPRRDIPPGVAGRRPGILHALAEAAVEHIAVGPSELEFVGGAAEADVVVGRVILDRRVIIGVGLRGEQRRRLSNTARRGPGRRTNGPRGNRCAGQDRSLPAPDGRER